MKRKFLLSLVMLIVAATCSLGLFACSIVPKSDEKQPQIVDFEAELIEVEGFTYNVSAKTCTATVSNATSELPLTDKVTVSNKATWVVSTTNAKSGAIESKTLSLSEGDNHYYIIVTSGDGKTDVSFSVTVHRRAMYTVTFDTDGGTPVPSQSVEEGYLIKNVPSTTKAGFIFAGWSYDFGTPVTSDITITASWREDPASSYKVEYYLQNVGRTDYELKESETFPAETGESVTAEQKGFAHFTFNEKDSTTSGTVIKGGTLILKLYYTRNVYTVTVNSADTDKGTVTGGGEYVNAQVVDLSASAKSGWTFDGWYEGDNLLSAKAEYSFNPTNTMVIVAAWKANTDTEYKVEHYKDNELVETETLTGTTGEKVTATEKTYDYYSVDEDNSTLEGAIVGDGSLTLKVYYVSVKFNVLISSKNVNEGTVTGGGEGIVGGTEITVKTTPKDGYSFDGWLNGGEEYLAPAEFNLTVTENITLTAKWKKNTYNYTVNYYFENLNGEYVLDDSLTVISSAEFGATVYAEINSVEHYNINEEKTVKEGVIPANNGLILSVYYKRDTYTVTFDGNGGTLVSGEETQTVKYEGSAVAPTYEMVGYTFAGFNKAFDNVSMDIEVKALWTAKTGVTYKVYHYRDNVIVDEEHDIEEFEGTTGDPVRALYRTSDDFAYYDYDKVNSTATGTIAGDGSLELKLYYTVKHYTVNLEKDRDDGVVSGEGSYTHFDNVTITAGAIDGYSFAGWYKSGELFSEHAEYTFNPTENVTLTAKWTANTDTPYTVEYYKDGEIVSADTQNLTGTTGQTVVVSNPSEKYPYYEYNSAISTASGKVLGDGSLVLKLYYTAQTFVVTLEKDNEEGTVEGAGTYKNADTAIITASEVTGYDFIGWFNGSTLFSKNADCTFNPTQNITLTAKWTKHVYNYSVKYYFENSNGYYVINDDETENLTAEFGKTVNAQIKTFPNFTYNEGLSTATGVIPANNDLILSVYYSINRFTVTLDKNVEKGTVTGGGAFLADEQATVIASAIDGYIFTGWYKGDDKLSSDLEYTFTVTEDVTLTAKWVADDETAYTVEIYLQNIENDEYTLESSDILYGETDTTASVTPESIEHFTYNASISKVSGTIVADGSLVLKVYYTRDTYTVTFNGDGGTLVSGVETQTVKYLGSAVAPVYEKTGYHYSFDVPFNNISSDVFVSAIWTANTDTAYKVEYYLQNLDDDGYTLNETLNLKGTTDDYVNADVKTIEHYEFTSEGSVIGGTIAADGSLILKVYYLRDVYTVTVTKNIETGTVTGDGEYRYGKQVTVTANEISGYDFTGWKVADTIVSSNLEYSFTANESITVTAVWSARESAYTVEYYKQNLADNNFTIDSSLTENLMGMTDTVVDAEIKTIAHFTFTTSGSVTSGTVLADGSLVLKVYYTRNTYNVTFNGNGGTLVSGEEIQTVKYQGSAVAPTYSKAGYNYEFDKAFINISEDIEVTAVWTARTDIDYTVEIYLQNVANDEYTKDNSRTQTLKGTTDSNVSVTPESIEHFAYNASLSTVSGKVLADGSLVLKVYYTRNKYHVSISSANEDVTLSKTYNAEYKYNALINDITATVKGYLGYEWSGWYINDELVSTELTYPSFRVSGPVTIVAKAVAKAEMSAFTFTSTATTCVITGLTDKSVKTIVIPGYVTSVNDGAFNGATIENATVPMFAVSKVKSTSLKNLTITNGTAIADSALEGCTALSSVTIPSTVKSIGANAFKGCTALTSVTLPSGLTSIGNYAFSESGLTSISIPNTVTSLGEYAFYKCSALATANIPTAITAIPAHLFNDCIALSAITLPEGTTSIGEYAFRKCTSLTTIAIPLSVETIGAHAFEGSTGLTKVTFSGESTHTRTVTVVSSVDDYSVVHQGTGGAAPSLSSASSDYTKIANLNSWGDRVNSKQVTFDGLTVYFKVNNYDAKPIGWGITNSASGYSVVESTSAAPYFNATIRPAGTWAFMYYQRSHAGENNGSVYHQVAYSNSTLTQKAYGVDGTSKYGFGGESSEIPTSLAYSIKFEKFDSTGTVYKLTTTGITNFGRCDSNVTYVSSSYIPNTGYICVWGMESGTQNIYVKYSYETTETVGTDMIIGDGAFSSCSALNNITLPSGVTSIGNYAFHKCSALTSFTIPASVTTIGNYAFDQCTNLATVNFKGKGSTTTISTSTSDLTKTAADAVTLTQNDDYVDISKLNTFGQRINSASAQTIDGLTVYYNVTGYNNKPIGFGLTTSATGYSIPTDNLDANNTFNATIRPSTEHIFLFYQLNHAGEDASADHQHMIAYNDPELTEQTGETDWYGIDGTRKYSFVKTTTFEYAIHFEKYNSSVYKITITGITNMEKYDSNVVYVSKNYIPDTAYLCFWGLEGGTQTISVKFGHTTSTASFSIGSNAFTGCSKLKNYTFAGTKAQWAVVGKGAGWKDSSVTATVKCSDGNVTV